MSNGYFITGTDTGAGKSWISAGLLAYFQQQGLRALGMKPVASGCVPTAEGLRNEDALLLQKVGSFTVPYGRVNPYAFEPAVAPHLAAEQAGVEIDLAHIVKQSRGLAANCDRLVVEGVGGWQVPLNGREGVAELARALGYPVILVVGMRLGCINHALLSAESIRAAGCELAGWVANQVDPQMALVEENIESIAARIGVPLLGRVPHLERLDARDIAARLSLPL